MNVDVVLLPAQLGARSLSGATVVVFDVLRATTTMAAALSAGVCEIRIFADTAAARAAAAQDEALILCGEEKCLPPAGFHLGNSPSAFDAAVHRGKTVCMSTTNGTRAILAAAGARRIFTGAIVNASAVARAVRESDARGGDVVLLCAGTNGQVAAEDVIGAGAVLHALRTSGEVRPGSDTAHISEDLFLARRHDLPAALRHTAGGRNVTAAGLDADIDFAARVDGLVDVVGEVHAGDPPIVKKSFGPGCTRMNAD